VRRVTVAAGALLALAGCATTQPTHAPEDIDGRVVSPDGSVVVAYNTADVRSESAAFAARDFAVVRDGVARELALEKTPAELLQAEIVVRRGSESGQSYYMTTHANIVEGPRGTPLRVRLDWPLKPDETIEGKIASFRATVAHEITEATLLAHVRLLDPYLRWMHDGIAESVAHRVVARLDPATASAERDRRRDRWRRARDRKLRWLDLTGWRQSSTWVVHSDSFFKTDSPPLFLSNVTESLKRIADDRFQSQETHEDELAASDALADFVTEVWKREHLPPGDGEIDLRRSTLGTNDARDEETQFLCYSASMCIWLELEQASPGITGRFLASLMASNASAVRAADVIQMVRDLAKVDVRPRLERFTCERLESVLAAEK
jgi:hypothetical protein